MTEQGCLPKKLLESPAFLLGKIGMIVKESAIDAFEAAGFGPWQYGVMSLLDEGARETQAMIAEVLEVDRSQLVGVLDQLEARGSIERKRDPNDRRRQIVSLTPAGRRDLAALRKVAKGIEEEFLAPLSERERQTLNDLLLRVGAGHDRRFVLPKAS